MQREICTLLLLLGSLCTIDLSKLFLLKASINSLHNASSVLQNYWEFCLSRRNKKWKLWERSSRFYIIIKNSNWRAMDQFMCLKLRTHSSVLLSWRYCEIMLVLIFPTQKWPQNISSCTTCMVDQNFLLLSNTLFSSVLTKDSFVQCGWIPFLSFSYPRSGSNFTVDV